MAETLKSVALDLSYRPDFDGRSNGCGASRPGECR
jgi:hypothetical protein